MRYDTSAETNDTKYTELYLISWYFPSTTKILCFFKYFIRESERSIVRVKGRKVGKSGKTNKEISGKVWVLFFSSSGFLVKENPFLSHKILYVNRL